MRFLIIGLGIYGSNLAIDLTRAGHEVIGADKDPSLVESIKEYISTAYIIDTTDESALSVLPLKNVDLVVVAIGENFGASIRTVALLKKLNVKHIYARAIDQIHESILEGFEIDRIITPEQRAAADLVNELSFGEDSTTLHVDPTHMVVRFTAPKFLEGLKYSAIDLKKDFSLDLICALRKSSSKNLLGVASNAFEVINIATNADLTIQPGDMLTCYGSADAFHKIWNR